MAGWALHQHPWTPQPNLQLPFLLPQAPSHWRPQCQGLPETVGETTGSQVYGWKPSVHQVNG